ncbi:MAG: IS30 family transposase, partial [Clostridia bacterium]|nr:IS30 family transposase [Clostridia bacterium]
MGKHLTLNDRKFIEKMLKQKISVTVIADTLGVHRSTIYREIKKGTYLHTTKINGGFYKDVPTYSSDLGQQVYTNNRKKCVRPLKLSGDYLLEIESLLLKKYSPEMAVTACSYPHLVCTKTIYNYIDKCLFKKYRNVNLIHGKQKRHTTKDRTHKQKHSINNSIENRPVDILNREVFGHWEMDTVIGKIGKSNCLLVLTERKTRREFVYKLEDKTSKSVVNQLRALQRYYGKNYSKIFKTITVDNGAEFADVQGMKRFSGTQFYYCHPYSSWERGSNENRNKLIRRFIPKGTDIKKYSTDYIKSVEQFINNYPMRIHNY